MGGLDPCVMSFRGLASALDKLGFAKRHGGPWSVQVTLSAERKSPYPIHLGGKEVGLGDLCPSLKGEIHYLAV